jgi:DNA-binding beta-propeller fold protein YncE
MAYIHMLPDRDEIIRHVEKVERSFHIKGPELPVKYPWLNVSRPIHPDELRGKIVLLDFWTYCCINCLHNLPDLNYLEAKYEDQPFVVIGVHSAKFDNEREVENIRQAILRYEINHPVIVDQRFALWKAYAIHAWPTLILLDPDGNIEAAFSGEGNRESIDMYVEVMLRRYGEHGKLRNDPLPIRPERESEGKYSLRYPGKVLVDEDRRWLYIADSNNHRIVVTDLDGHPGYVIGGNSPGLADGTFEESRFYGPEGLAIYEGKLLVADTENHVIRQVDFDTRRVETIAGTGRHGHYFQGVSPARMMTLNSPWDLAVVADTCFIAMAGAHQIWALDMKSGTIRVFAGTGQEARIDGPRGKAGFAQPSGLATDGKYLYVADSETSSVRALDLENDGEVTTLVGLDLFEFGDVDGYREDARLQHPLDVEVAGGKIYIADTYNHKIKMIDPRDGQVYTYLGTGSPGLGCDDRAEFYEPSGLSVYRDRLYVADTNNHRVCVVNLRTEAVKELDVHSLAMTGAAERV